MIKVRSWMIFKCIFFIFNNVSFSSEKYFSIFWPFSCSKSSSFFLILMAKGQGNNSICRVKSLIVQLWKFCFRNSFFDHFSFTDSQPRHLFILGGRFFKCIKVDQQFISTGKILQIHPTRTFLNAFMLFILF